MILPMGPVHVDAVTRLHSKALRGLLSELGVPATRAYYTGCMRSPEAIGLVAVEDGAVRGFVLGAVDPQRLKREVLLRNPVGTAGALAIAAITRPSSMVWLMRSTRGPDEGTYDHRAAELIYLAVDVERRTSGLGKSLVDAFTRAMREAGVSSFQLSVDEDNHQAIRFYEAQRFEMIGRYREFGVLHRRYKLVWT